MPGQKRRACFVVSSFAERFFSDDEKDTQPLLKTTEQHAWSCCIHDRPRDKVFAVHHGQVVLIIYSIIQSLCCELGLVEEVLEVEVEDVSAGGEDVEALLAGFIPPLAQLVPVRHRRHRVCLTFDRHALAAVDVLQCKACQGHTQNRHELSA